MDFMQWNIHDQLLIFVDKFLSKILSYLMKVA